MHMFMHLPPVLKKKLLFFITTTLMTFFFNKIVCFDYIKNKLQVIQNNALRIILNKPKIMKTKIVDLHSEVNLETLETRSLKLRRRYVQKAISNNNPVILELIEEFKNYKGGRVLTRKTLLCDLYEDLSAGMNL